MTCGLSVGLRNLRKLDSVSWEVFCFAGIRLNPLSGKILYHDCVSVIVSRFTFFTENSVICCYQVTKLFCSRHWIASASSARSPCNFGPLADFALWVHREVCENTVLAHLRQKLLHPQNVQ